jgi:septal ring factor EnvC (AmiA/AmiB activator)
MNWQEIAGGIINSLRNAGVKKDVIDLQEKQVALLTQEIATLTRKLDVSETERANLESKVADLEQELDRLRPKRDLAEDTIKVLRLLFDHDLTLSQIANALGISEGIADYHCGVLRDRLMIQFPAFGMMGVEPALYITHEGREYLVKNGLV